MAVASAASMLDRPQPDALLARESAPVARRTRDSKGRVVVRDVERSRGLADRARATRRRRCAIGRARIGRICIMSAADVSVVIPTFNRARVLPRAIESVLAQTRRPGEIIVVDDGSTDETPELLHDRYAGAVRVVRQNNAGVSAARARGVAEASGEWIAFLDSDDEWLPEKLEMQTAATRELPGDVVWLFSNFRIARDDGADATLFESYGLACDAPVTIFDDATGVCYPFLFPFLQCSFLKRAALKRVDAFSEGLRSSEDFLLAVQMACIGRFAATPAPVAKVYRTSDLTACSLHRSGVSGVDYFRARVLAFDLLARRRGGVWRRRYREASRALAIALAEQRQRGVYRAGLAQLRHGHDAKTWAFLLLSLGGRWGVGLWRRARERKKPPVTHAGPDPLGLFA
ncbi:MAG: glycosyltransferase family 2 protein [Planctomycetota bacterium]|nr:MAG: glycosyltransferase family 2 protein [Planctomycetota bacterium]